MSTPLTLVSHHLCPYVQRAAIALAEMGVAFERIYVDLSDKPDWFRASRLWARCRFSRSARRRSSNRR